jgi:transcriptional regulator
VKYPPKHHQEQNYKNVITVLKQYPFGTLVTVHNNQPLITHIPLIYENDGSEFGKLVAHIDKYNPQVETLTNGAEATALFYGPDCYISPNVYSTTQLPTWNYIIVHLKGVIKRYEDTNTVKKTLIRMTDCLEGDTPNYKLTQDNPKMEAAINYIVGFEMQITHWEGKFKFSQDKLKRDQMLAKQALINSQKQEITAFLDTIFEAHKQ